ncbi:MAG: restriction endonuclease subunit S, partial [Pyrinomonadaceae bacterium]
TSGRQRVNKDAFANLELELPPIEEQKEIAEILSSLDDKIELNWQMNATLEAMARAMFKAWFVDFEPVRANMENRPSESASPEIAKLFPSEFENDIPKGWEDSTIGEIIYVQNGYAFKSSDFKESGTIKVIKIKNISNNQVDVTNTQFISESVSGKIDNKFKISSNDLLIAMTGAEVGKVGLVPKIDSEIWLNQRVGLIKEKIKNAKRFAYLVLSTDENRNNLLGAASGSAQPNISASQIERTSSIIPTNDIIEKFGELVNPIFEKISESRFENQKLAEIRDSLLPRLISGKIRVGEAENKLA